MLLVEKAEICLLNISCIGTDSLLREQIRLFGHCSLGTAQCSGNMCATEPHEVGPAFSSARTPSELGRCRSMGQTKAAGPCSLLRVYYQAVCLTSPSKKTLSRGIHSVPRQDHADLSLSLTMFGCRNWLGRQKCRASPVIPKVWVFPLKQMRYHHGCVLASAWD